MNWKSCGREWPWHNVGLCPASCLLEQTAEDHQVPQPVLWPKYECGISWTLGKCTVNFTAV